MKTIRAIQLLLEEYKQHIERIVARTGEEYRKEAQEVLKETMGKLRKLSLLFPDLMPASDGKEMSASDIDKMVGNLRARVSGKYSAPLLPSGEVLHDEIYGTSFDTPAFTEWQGGGSREANFVIEYKKASAGKAISAMNFLVGNMLLSLPVKQVHLTLVDLNGTGGALLFTKNLDKSLYTFIYSSQQLNEFCTQMQERMVTVLQECGNLTEYNEQNQTFRFPYEVVVLLDYPNKYDYVSEQLSSLFENGYRWGIYFVVLNNKDIVPRSQKESLIAMKDHYTTVGLDSPKSVLEDGKLSQAFFRYLKEEAQRKPEAKNAKADYKGMFSQPYLEMEDSTLVIPVGLDEGGNPAYYVTNIVDHVSSFVMGTVGSGKSSFLKSIIVDAMLTYSPEDLQFYLLDFKGVEMNMFKDSKHVRTLLTNGNDLDMTIEVFRDLTREYERRNREVFAASGCKDITSYNKRCPRDKRLPQIFLIADECQLLFSSSNSRNIRKYNDLTKMIVDLARLGRSTGIHLIFATQTLQGTDFPNDVLNVIHDKYLLRCIPADSERMIPDSSQYTESLPPGKVFCRINQEDRLFQSYFFTDDERAEIMGYIRDKAKDIDLDKPILIDGSQVFELTDTIISGLPAKRNNVAALGCTIDLQRKPVQISLKADDGENILFFGINDQEQVTRTVMNALTTLVRTAKDNGRKLHVSVIDSTGIEDGQYLVVLDRLCEEGLVFVIRKRDVGSELYRIASGIADGTAEPTLLVILGQERMRDLRMDSPIELAAAQPAAPAAGTDISKVNLADLMKTPFGTNPGSPVPRANLNTFRKALAYILENGPHSGVNTLLQVDTPSKVLHDPYVNARTIYGWFNHLVMLRSEEKAALLLGLNDEVHLEQLPSEKDLLRAIYYSADRDVYQTFTPYVQTGKQQ